jgi:hypothetical protein
VGAAFADAFEATERRYGNASDACPLIGGHAIRSSLPLKKTLRADKRQ